MSISPILRLSEPAGTDKISRGTFAYFKARLKQRMFNAIVGEFRKSGLTKADYGKRLGMDAAQVNRLLSGPGNLTLETVSSLLFAATGAELGVLVDYPLHRQESRDVQPRPLESVRPLARRNADIVANDIDSSSNSGPKGNYFTFSESIQERDFGGFSGLMGYVPPETTEQFESPAISGATSLRGNATDAWWVAINSVSNKSLETVG